MMYKVMHEWCWYFETWLTMLLQNVIVWYLEFEMKLMICEYEKNDWGCAWMWKYCSETMMIMSLWIYIYIYIYMSIVYI